MPVLVVGGEELGDVLSVSFNADTGESPTVRRGVVLLAPVTPGRGEDFLENVARTVLRRRGWAAGQPGSSRRRGMDV